MGSQSRRHRTINCKRTDQLGQSSRPIAQANEDRLRLRRQRYAEEQAERRAASSSQHVASGSQWGIRRKVIEMVDKLKSLSSESVEYESKILTRFLNHSSIRKALKVESIMSLNEQHIAKLLLANLSNGLQTIKRMHTRDDMIAKRKVQAIVCQTVESNFLDLIRSRMSDDLQAQQWMAQLETDVVVRSLQFRDGLLFFKQCRVYVPAGELRTMVLRENHDCELSCHGGQNRTFQRLQEHFFWPNMKEDVAKYVQTCVTCQKQTVEHKRTAGQIVPLLIPDGPWESISMDFCMDLPESGGFNALWVVVDRFSKQMHLIPCRKTLSSLEAAKLFIQDIFKYHGLPKEIVSDLDVRFVTQFWKGLFQMLGSSYHSQTDGQTERVIRIVEQGLRNYILKDQKDWSEHLDLLEFAYNNTGVHQLALSYLKSFIEVTMHLGRH
ncbi:hypothetical protein R1sor_006499 [Riccia sorocarpa]|uniref:Integrase catalytic domain-containing protein n=1 Tax=Riccia sorocarpa TaxID=122646 RepID=A0ABD3HN55_9MARC